MKLKEPMLMVMIYPQKDGYEYRLSGEPAKFRANKKGVAYFKPQYLMLSKKEAWQAIKDLSILLWRNLWT